MIAVVLGEPQIESVHKSQVVTSCVKVKTIDLYSVKTEDLAFENDFRLKVQRNDYVHAFVTHFVCEFSKCHTRIKLSTSPKRKQTHWRQTVFYVNEPIVVKARELISGKFTMRPCSLNPVSARMLHVPV